jgi:hypothetical protein
MYLIVVVVVVMVVVMVVQFSTIQTQFTVIAVVWL